ncbi:SCO family protein [Actinacidiphila glaucinigra]|uniref:Protein SCO1/2 n=1 Tax=Actinacidiphila glaucinigra TaxID=235986 RepID=A0A239HXX3_9ACTN|nr:SCO family protein [Actinacidiphila glaucinigra]SNS86286.1 protein SCO1/2 [Actinacidiphila glaucinigra]
MRTTLRAAASAAAVAALALTLAACGGSDGGTDASGAGPVVSIDATPKAATVLDTPFEKPDMVLTDTHGKTYDFTERTKGRPTLLFFGYTHCPDVCPTTMSDIAIAKSKLPAAEQDRLVVVFVTTDPERDTPKRLGEWLGAQDKSFVGLTGDFATIEAGARSLGVDVEKPVKEKDGSITVTHGAQVIAYSPKDDKAHALYMSGTTSEEFAADLPKIIAGRTP